MNHDIERIGPERFARVLGAALSRQLLTEEAPALIFHDLDRLAGRLERVRAAFPATTLHAVAIKANPLVEVLRFVVGLGAGLEAASLEEVALAIAAGCPSDRIIYDSPAKSRSDLRFALARGIRLNADNFDELARISEVLADAPSCSAIGLRINPLVGSGRIQSTSVGARTSQFGVPLTQANQQPVLDAFARYPWLTALHVHVGSQGCSLEQLVAGVQRAQQLRRLIEERLGTGRIKTLDIGGGLPVAYTESDHPPSVTEYVSALRREVPEVFDLELVTEFGRHLQANSGWAVSRVEYVKDLGDERLAMVHLGADFMLRRAYRPEDWPLEMLVLDARGRLKSTDRPEPWTIAGPLCFSGDILGRGVPLPAIEPGDLVVFRDQGAYTLGMWSRHCSRGIPAVYGYSGDDPDFRLLRPRERPEDIVSFWGG